MYRLLDLFSGIGGFSLGLERSGGFRTVAFCEIDPYCRRVLRKHWPEVPLYDDVRTLTAERLAADGITVDAICGGFPCQDLSTSGGGAGLDGERSGLWREFARLIRELRPKYVIVENSPELLDGWAGEVFGTLVEVGLDIEWHCVPASSVGAPHRRDRVWIFAYPAGVGQSRPWQRLDAIRPTPGAFGEANRLVDAFQTRALPFVCGGHDGISSKLDGGLNGREKTRSRKDMQTLRREHVEETFQFGPSGRHGSVQKAHVLRQRMPAPGADQIGRVAQTDHDGAGKETQETGLRSMSGHGATSRPSHGPKHSQQRQGQSDDIVRALSQSTSRGTPRVAALGNAVVPQIPELIGRAILASEKTHAPS